ncbi:MAG: sialidase family protein [Thermoplasmatota archaeon]
MSAAGGEVIGDAYNCLPTWSGRWGPSRRRLPSETSVRAGARKKRPARKDARMTCAAALLVVLLAGWMASTAGPSPAPSSSSSLALPVFREPVVLPNVGADGAEPNIVASRDHIYVAAWPSLWRSADGARYEAMGKAACASATVLGNCPPGETETASGLDARGDEDFAVDANGTLYFAGLDGPGGSVPFQLSRDDAVSWSASHDLAGGNVSDREWIDVQPGAVVVTWRDFGAPGDGGRPAHLVARTSHDGGATWGPLRVIRADALEGPPAHDPRTGALYVAFYDGGVRVARSRDQGVSWDFLNVTRDGRDLSARSNPTYLHIVTAVDAAGNVYVAWSQDEGAPAAPSKALAAPRVYLAASQDGGATWGPAHAVSAPGHAAVLPGVVAGKDGHIAMAWYENEHGLPSETLPDLWDVEVVEAADGAAASPHFVGGHANRAPIHLGAICTEGGGCDRACLEGQCQSTRTCPGGLACAGKDRSRLDFFQMALDARGQPVMAWVADSATGLPDLPVQVEVGGVAAGTPLT